jgi:hypothetical protein
VERTPFKSWHDAARVFKQNVASVLELLQFDRDIINTAVGGLKSTADELEDRHHLRSVAIGLRNRAAMLDRVSESDSLRPKYATMFNHCVVLLVSYFDSGLHDVFRSALIYCLRSNVDVPARAAKLEVSWRALEQGDDQRERIFADLFVAQKDISFQDMQSVVRAFKDAMGVTLERSAHTDNVILAQAARHVVVHAGSVVDERMSRQVSGATLRTLKRRITIGEPLRFTPEEVHAIAASMTAYVDQTCALLDTRLPKGE